MIVVRLTSSRPLEADSAPIKLDGPFEIPRKSKIAPDNAIPNGTVNGHVSDEAPSTLKRKRSLENTNETPISASKKGKLVGDQVTVIDDNVEGAILIDD